MKCEFGFCVCCEKEIAPACGSCGKRKPGNDYTEVMLNLSDGSKTHQPVCIACSQGPIWKIDKAELSKHWHAMFEKTGIPHPNKDVSFV